MKNQKFINNSSLQQEDNRTILNRNNNLQDINNNTQNSSSNSNNPESILEQIEINSQTESSSSEVIKGVKKRSLSQESDSSHINLKRKGLTEESSNVESSDGVSSGVESKVLTAEQQEIVNKIVNESNKTLEDLADKKGILLDSTISEYDFSSVLVHVCEKIDTKFDFGQIILDKDCFKTIWVKNSDDTLTPINVFKDANNIVNPVRLSSLEPIPGLIASPNLEPMLDITQNTESPEDLSILESFVDIVESIENDDNLYYHENANPAPTDFQLETLPEVFTEYPARPDDHVLSVSSTDDSRSGIDPEESDDYDSDIYNMDISSVNSNAGMVDLFTEATLDEIEYSESYRWDRFEYENYLIDMKGVDNLGYRTMFEDVKEYLEIINELKDKKMDILQNSDIINNDQLQKVIHEIFEALLFIAQFS